MGIPNIPSTEISNVVVNAYENGTPVLLYGSPGIGKSQGVFKAVEILGEKFGLKPTINSKVETKEEFGMRLIIMSNFAPEDVNGLPYVVDGETKFAKTGFIPTTPETKGIVFLDEIGNAEEYKFAPLQSLISERRVGEWKVPDGYVFVLATNKPEDGTGARELPSAIRNRCMQFEVVAPMGEDYVNMMKSIDRKLDMRVEGFLLTFPAESYTFNPAKTASATLRTWEQFSKMLPNLKTLKDETLVLGGLMGTDVSSKYKAWRKLSDKFKLSDIIKDPESVTQYEHDKGLLYNICLNLIEHAAKSRKNIIDAFNVAVELKHDEFSMYIINNLTEHYKLTVMYDAIKGDKNFAKIAETLKKYRNFYVGE